MQKFLQNFKKPDVLLRKTKDVQTFFDRLFAKNFHFFLQNLCNPFPYVIGFLQKLNFESGSKQRFSLLQEKAVIQAGSVPDDLGS